MILVLGIILLVLMVIVGGDRGAKSFIALIGNIVTLILGIYLIVSGLNPILVTILGVIVLCQITLIYQNGHNIKTYSAVISVIVITLILSLVILFIGNISKVGGYSELDLTSDISVYMSANININMNTLMICMVIISLIGAIMDTAMAITSSLHEFNEVNNQLTFNELVKLGFNVGKDILGTTVNTIFFATVGETLMLSILFIKHKYVFETLVNSKEFFQIVFNLVASNIGCLLIIPISIYICTYMIKSDNKLINNIKDYCKRIDSDDNEQY